MTFTQAIQNVFSNYANFNGRARRSEYWYFVLFNLIVNGALNALAQFAQGSHFAWIFTGASGLFSLAILVPTLALNWRRMHDIGKSGAWYFIMLIPLVGQILYLVWCCTDSQPGDNMYGPNPKGIGGMGMGPGPQMRY